MFSCLLLASFVFTNRIELDQLTVFSITSRNTSFILHITTTSICRNHIPQHFVYITTISMSESHPATLRLRPSPFLSEWLALRSMPSSRPTQLSKWTWRARPYLTFRVSHVSSAGLSLPSLFGLASSCTYITLRWFWRLVYLSSSVWDQDASLLFISVWLFEDAARRPPDQDHAKLSRDVIWITPLVASWTLSDLKCLRYFPCSIWGPFVFTGDTVFRACHANTE